MSTVFAASAAAPPPAPHLGAAPPPVSRSAVELATPEAVGAARLVHTTPMSAASAGAGAAEGKRLVVHMAMDCDGGFLLRVLDDSQG